MDPQKVFCPNLACPARGRRGAGNIGIHSRKEQRYRCRECGQTFAARKGTAFYRLRTAADTVTLVITLLAHGCPVQAIVAAFGLDERTVANWQRRAGQQSQAVHEYLVEQPRDLGHVQADEIRVKKQGGIVWMALALMVRTRLWLGGAVSTSRNTGLLTTLLQKVRTAATSRSLWLCVDGRAAYLRAARQVFRHRLWTGQAGRPRWQPWSNRMIAQMIKQYQQGRVVGVIRRVHQGTTAAVDALLQGSQGGGGVINTAFIERLNATFRSRLGSLVRRGRALARQVTTLHQGMYLVGSVYNFCTDHDSLRQSLGRHRWLQRTPAMAVGITEHRWSVRELLAHPVPPSPWIPPQRPGRPSRALQLQIERWCR